MLLSLVLVAFIAQKRLASALICAALYISIASLNPMVVSTQSSGVICELVGIVGDAQYHRWRMLLRELSVVQAQILPRLHGFLEDEYFAFLEARKTMIQRAKLQELQQTTSTYVLINECELIDTEDRLLALLTKKTQISNGELLAIAAFGASSYDNESSSPTEKQQELLCSAEESLQSKAETAAQEALFRYRQISGHHFAFLLFEVNGVALPRVEIELYHRVCPQTCKNFLAFCRGVVPDVTDTERMLGYTGNQVHRVVRDGWIQAGDVAGDGRGDGPCRSIDGLEFADESFDISHNSAGIVVSSQLASLGL